MRPEDKDVKVGNISTYENASDAFLKNRAQDIRSSIRDPKLKPSEFTQTVGTQTAFSALATGFTSWNTLNRVLEWAIQHVKPDASSNTLSGRIQRAINPLIDRMSIDNIHLMRDASGYRTVLHSVTGQLADFLYGEHQTIEDGLKVVQSMIDEPASLGHSTDDLVGLKKELSGITDLDEFRARFKAGLEKIHKADPQRHLGKYALIWQEMDRLDSTRPAQNAPRNIWQILTGKQGAPIRDTGRSRAIMGDALNAQVRDIIDSGRRDNIKIISKYNAMVTVPLTVAVAAAVGWKTYHGANKQKLLDLESEASFIERLTTERENASKSEHKGAASSSPHTQINAHSVSDYHKDTVDVAAAHALR